VAYPTLNTNKVFSSLYNMIISMQIFGTGIENLSGIYSGRKVDGTLIGDTKLYVSSDVLKSYAWDGTDTPGAYNLLTVHRPPAPVQTAIVIDTYRQIPVTVDAYLTKQAFMDEGAFSQFNGVVLSWLSKTKEVYEHTKYTADITITAQAEATALGSAIVLYNTDLTGYDLLRWQGQELARKIEDRLMELSEPSRAYNDNGFLRTYSKEDFDIIVPIGVLSSIRKHDVPFLYNVDEKPIFKEIHWKYFGAKNAAAGTTLAANTTVRALVEKDFGSTHCFPGDLLPNGTAYGANETYTASYTSAPSLGGNDVTILLVHKQDFPIMSAFSVGTSFFNARRLDMNHYLTFGHNNVQNAHIGEYALLKITTDVAA
jgi:hypothetical protein